MEQAIDIIVDTWTYAAADQLLERTRSIYFTSNDASHEAMGGRPGDEAGRPSALGISSQGHGSRHGSLAGGNNISKAKSHLLPNDGLKAAAAHRSRLCLLQRRVLERIGNACGLPCGITAKLISTAISNNGLHSRGSDNIEAAGPATGGPNLDWLRSTQNLPFSSLLTSSDNARRHSFVSIPLLITAPRLTTSCRS